MQELKANLPIMVKPDAQEPAKEAPSAGHLQTVQDTEKARTILAVNSSRGNTFSEPAYPVKVHLIYDDANKSQPLPDYATEH